MLIIRCSSLLLVLWWPLVASLSLLAARCSLPCQCTSARPEPFLPHAHRACNRDPSPSSSPALRPADEAAAEEGAAPKPNPASNPRFRGLDMGNG